jgi:hypothetical protein
MHWFSIFHFLLLSTSANATKPKTTLRFEIQLDVDMIDIGVQQADEPVVGDALPSATMIDNRKRYSFDSKTNDEIKAANFQHWRWTRSGRDGTYIVQPKDTSKIQLQHIKDLDFSRVLAQEGDILKATGSDLQLRVQNHQRVFIVSPDDGDDLIWFDFWRLIFRRA